MTDLAQASFEEDGVALSKINITLQKLPEIANFQTYQGAYDEISRRVPDNFFMGFQGLTKGEKIAGGITIISGLAIAYVLEMQQLGVELFSHIPSQEEIDITKELGFDNDSFSLNIQSLFNQTQNHYESVGDEFLEFTTAMQDKESFSGALCGVLGM